MLYNYYNYLHLSLALFVFFSAFWVHSNVSSHNRYTLDCANNDPSCQCNAFPSSCQGTECKKMCQSLVKGGEMDLECSGEECEQTCNAQTCKLRRTTQMCYDKGKVCKIDLKHSGGDCQQFCDAKTCKLKCIGGQCKKQHCNSGVNICNMHCNAINCTQTCDAVRCHITRTWPTSPRVRVKCSGNGQCCGSLMSSLYSYPLTQGIFSTASGGDKCCTCTKCLRSFCSSSDSYRSNFVSSASSTASQGFATQISTVQRKDKSHTWCE